MKLHASGEDYLEAILMLQKKSGMVRSVDLARHMGFSKPSISHAVGVLRDGGFLTVDKDGFLHLTDIGREIAEKIYERHRFFTEQLVAAGVDHDLLPDRRRARRLPDRTRNQRGILSEIERRFKEGR